VSEFARIYSLPTHKYKNDGDILLITSSKSLAIRLVSSNLRGTDSDDEYFRKLPQVIISSNNVYILLYLECLLLHQLCFKVVVIPHQGSSSSTSDGILKVFQKAEIYRSPNPITLIFRQ